MNAPILHRAIADAMDPGDLEELEALLDDFDGLVDARDEVQFACDVALDRYAPVIEAAYYFGLAIGLRLAAAPAERS